MTINKYKVRCANIVVAVPFGALCWFCLTGQATQWIHFQGQINLELTFVASFVMTVCLLWSSIEKRPIEP